jgi:hypothetical protein
MDSKTCIICHKSKELLMFSRNKYKKGGFHSMCKECIMSRYFKGKYQ